MLLTSITLSRTHDSCPSPWLCFPISWASSPMAHQPLRFSKPLQNGAPPLPSLPFAHTTTWRQLLFFHGWAPQNQRSPCCLNHMPMESLGVQQTLAPSPSFVLPPLLSSLFCRGRAVSTQHKRKVHSVAKSDHAFACRGRECSLETEAKQESLQRKVKLRLDTRYHFFTDRDLSGKWDRAGAKQGAAWAQHRFPDTSQRVWSRDLDTLGPWPGWGRGQAEADLAEGIQVRGKKIFLLSLFPFHLKIAQGRPSISPGPTQRHPSSCYLLSWVIGKSS